MLSIPSKHKKSIVALAATLLFTVMTVLPASADTTTLNYTCTSSMKTFIAPYTGTYTLKVWGAQGGYSGGEGGYAQGNITLNQNDTLNIFVGGQGSYSNANNSACYGGGYNGGGAYYTGNQNYITAGGGGGTDIRLNGTALTNRIIVAGGGGGGCN